MAITIFRAEQLNFPEHIAKKLKGRKIEFVETNCFSCTVSCECQCTGCKQVDRYLC